MIILCSAIGFSRFTRAEFESDLESNLRTIEEYGVKRSQIRFFLPPYEHYNQEIADWTKAMAAPGAQDTSIPTFRPLRVAT